MESMKRTATCGELTAAAVGREVTLNGWVHRVRDYGKLKFLDLRDRYGLTQVVVDADAAAELKAAAEELKNEYTVAVEGTVRPRPANMVNPHMPTGQIEVQARRLAVLARCATLPFQIDERSDAREELRFKYRFLDLRSFGMQRRIRLRHDVIFAVREYLAGRGFYEIETPTLIRSTPEGARDFLVPSRLHAGQFYALPQSPQLYKQLLMVSGFDKYFQIARCYRDEDARGDRQLEFTQIDLEMSFVSKDDVFEVIEGLLAHVFQKTMDRKLSIPFPRLPYTEAMNRFGSDKPDLRFGLELKDFSALAAKGEFEVFKKLAAEGGTVKALVAAGCGGYSRKEIAALEEVAKVYGAAGLASMKVTEAGLEGGIAKFYAPLAGQIVKDLEAQPGDLLLLVGADWKKACTSLGAVRAQLGRDLKLAKADEFHFSWIVDFPMFEWNEQEKKWDPAHHMFTMPQERYLSSLESDPAAVKGELYDLVCNGVELASGSIRVHDPELQSRIFKVVGLDQEEAHRRFGFLLEAFRYGPPPHGGIAPGLDRLVTLMAGESSIREVIAFPKNTLGQSPMDDCPAEVDAQQLADLHLRVVEPGK
ncbi:MAG: aspartate--tRNA ligase [Spirochaetes bacterium GWB1_66_5]|nr:MAG: aspartate--tRNA ligase [Spirochaetes bacterium GWB1_66_5]